MDRQAHDYAAYQQQQHQRQPPPQQQPQPPPQQQFGYPPQAQQFHPQPFGAPHPHLQQFPYHPHLQQQPPPQVLSHAPPPHPHHLPPPPAFAPHLPPRPLIPPPFHGGPPPPAAAPPSDPELHKRIDKLVEYSAKNGPDFEAMIREKQQDNPDYAFLFGGEGHSYYRYKLYASTAAAAARGGSFNLNSQFAPPPPHMLRPPPNPMMNAPPPYFYDQQRHNQQQFGVYGRPEYDQAAAAKPFKGLSGPLPPDVVMELSNVLMTLNGTKESIKGAKFWFMQRSIFAPALAEALRERVCGLDDPERQLHLIFLANDILFDSSHRRTGEGLDNESLALKPILGSMLARIYHNPQITEDNQMKLQQILQLWVSNQIYDQETIDAFRNEMIGVQSSSSFPGLPKDLSTTSTDSAAGLPPQWQPDRQGSVSSSHDQEHLDKHVPPGQSVPLSMPPQQFLPNSVPPAAFAGSLPIPSSVPPAIPQPLPHLLPGQAATGSEKLPPYPLFPPGLIPEMVRKMQIGSGVPYSPMSPLDIPTIIPPSTVPQSEILDRVSKFFKEIGEVNPSEGPIHGPDGIDNDDHEASTPVRKGGACIPPPPNLQVDTETGTYSDGSVDRKSGSGRLGLGATANLNEVSQYDDVYSSYRKQRSTNYHSSMSARAAAR